MAKGNLSPRQKMINMMYLVLTALLALNVSKEVLNSFFEVNQGIERTTTNFGLKNNEVYTAFDNAASNNPEKYQSVRDDAYTVKRKSDAAVVFIQEMKFDLVNGVDGAVYLGSPSDIFDEKGDLVEDKKIEGKSFNELTDQQKNMPIGYLNRKDDRNRAGELFYPKTGGDQRKASLLKAKIEDYRKFLVEKVKDNESLVKNINSVCDVSDKNSGKTMETWETYNFVDMPSVGALTILSKWQSDLRNLESDVINYLKRSIDAKSLKFTSAQGIAIPKSNFVLRGDSFRAEIFITARNESQNPEIYVGEYDTLSFDDLTGEGSYEMIGDYENIRVVNGKGMFAQRANTEGVKKWGGLIAMKTETGTKMYPFKGEYLVAGKGAVVSPTNMNILYLEVDNPLKISAAGYTANEITATINNGKISPTKKSAGEYSARPSKKGKATVTLYANVEGKRTKMGDMEFRVKEVPPPKAKIYGSRMVDGVVVMDKIKMVNAGGVLAELEDFDFKGVRYTVISYRLSGIYKGEQLKEDAKGPKFTKKMEGIIKNTKAGNSITISNIKAKRTDAKNTRVRPLDPLVIELK